jgi:hypothetical protein
VNTTVYLKTVTFLILYGLLFAQGQAQQPIDLQHLFNTKKLEIYAPQLKPVDDGGRHGLSVNGIVWLTDMEFSIGTIDIDLKGRNVPQESFLGIAFHGVDTSTYDAIYFRPFNFNTTDPVRKIHAVQYVSMPDYPWFRLRDEQNGQFEKEIIPSPVAEDWFHARVVVGKEKVLVYVNHSTIASLEVKLLNNRTAGKLGLWDVGLPGDFANLQIRKD